MLCPCPSTWLPTNCPSENTQGTVCIWTHCQLYQHKKTYTKAAEQPETLFFLFPQWAPAGISLLISLWELVEIWSEWPLCALLSLSQNGYSIKVSQNTNYVIIYIICSVKQSSTHLHVLKIVERPVNTLVLYCVPQAVPEQWVWCVRAHCPAGGPLPLGSVVVMRGVFLVHNSVWMGGSCQVAFTWIPATKVSQ